MKHNKQLLIDEEAKGILKSAKEALAKESAGRLSFSSIIKEFIDKHIKFLSLPEDIRAYISAFADLASKKEGVLGLLLFGSVARGTYGRDSDIDVLVIVKDNVLKYYTLMNDVKTEVESLRDAFVKRRYHLRISVTVLDEEGLKTFRPIYIEFLLDGITLYEKDLRVTSFLNSIRKIRFQRVFTKRGEELRWKRSRKRR